MWNPGWQQQGPTTPLDEANGDRRGGGQVKVGGSDNVALHQGNEEGAA